MSDGRPICPKCNAPMVEGCDGQGYILVHREVDEGFNPEHVQQCPNLYARQLADHLGKELALVQHVTSSPLLELEDGRDLTGSNLLIEKCPWRNLLPHLKWVLGNKGLLFFFRIVTDEGLKDVWVGNKAYKAMSSEAREVVPTFNSLSDLLGADIDLVIIKVGYLGQLNRAAPGLLKEALLIRESLHKPTWLVLDPNRPWTFSYNPDVGEYVKQNFKAVRVPPADPGIDGPNDLVTVDDDGEVDDEEMAEVMASVEEDWEPPPERGSPGRGSPPEQGSPDSGPVDLGPMS